MTELSFLLDLLMNHKLQKATKEAIAIRIKEVEIAMNEKPQSFHMQRPNPTNQAASTLAAMAKHEALNPEPIPIPIEEVAHTPAAAAAIERRNNLMLDPAKRPADPATGRPRKF